MITSKSGGSGTYSFHERSVGTQSVTVSHMPENQWKVRVSFRSNGETHIPTILIGLSEAECLWAALNAMAKDLKWEDHK